MGWVRGGFWRAAPWWMAALATALVVACGGGVGTGGTGSFASGPITGFGSIIVQDVHFDESAATVDDDDGDQRARGDLRLGQMVEIDSGAISNGAATASQVRIVSALVGRVDSVAADSLVVNGQTVRINAGTVFDDSLVGGIAAIAVGRVVEVFGYIAATDITATRIEPDDGATSFKFRGVVSALDTKAHTFDIGSAHFVYDPGVSGAAALRNGAFMRVLVGLQPDAQGRWVVSALGGTGPVGGDRDEAKARGVITAFTSSASFAVGGIVIDASGAQINGGPLALGLRVEVEGRLVSGVLVASSVEVEDKDQTEPLELRGAVATLDTLAKVFTVSGRSERVSYARSDIEYDNGTEADLKQGAVVRVTGQLSADGTLIEATRIRFGGD
ncbi:MAG TPA: DUF5666 domain-containing protein [Burkholderiaceae bacterium]|nr:DUF5666 domain-containing protein [Burkholderiaceae bacterium]